jgi:GT2 family glycosyltransferase
MISIITGTLDRGPLLQGLIENTVEANENLELVLVDGGSTDGTIKYIKEENHPRIKLIEVGERSRYSHFMNLGIRHASHDIICQWNDDVLLANDWEEVFSEIDEESDFYLFNWKYGDREDIKNPNWLYGHNHIVGGWCMLNNIENPIDYDGVTPVKGELVMNYGLYKKHIFKKIGMYNHDYLYYGADADLSTRAYRFGYKVKDLRNIKVCSLNNVPKKAYMMPGEQEVFDKNMELYKQKVLPNNIEFL